MFEFHREQIWDSGYGEPMNLSLTNILTPRSCIPYVQKNHFKQNQRLGSFLFIFFTQDGSKICRYIFTSMYVLIYSFRKRNLAGISVRTLLSTVRTIVFVTARFEHLAAIFKQLAGMF